MIAVTILKEDMSPALSQVILQGIEGKNQALVGAIPYYGEHPGPWFEDKFRSAKQMDGISKADEIK